MLYIYETFDDVQRIKSPIRIILADDHPLLRKAIKNELSKQEEFEVVAEAGDGEEVIKLAEKLSPDIIIMDIAMPKLNGLEATKTIKSAFPNIYILVLTVHNDIEHIMSILGAGAEGYLTKDAMGDEIIQAIRSIINGDNILSPQVLHQIIQYSSRQKLTTLLAEPNGILNGREIEILKLVASGYGNKVIAEKLKLSPSTIRGYLEEIFPKLNAMSRTESVVNALKMGILTIKDLK